MSVGVPVSAKSKAETDPVKQLFVDKLKVFSYHTGYTGMYMSMLSLHPCRSTRGREERKGKLLA